MRVCVSVCVFVWAWERKQKEQNSENDKTLRRKLRWQLRHAGQGRTREGGGGRRQCAEVNNLKFVVTQAVPIHIQKYANVRVCRCRCMHGLLCVPVCVRVCVWVAANDYFAHRRI